MKWRKLKLYFRKSFLTLRIGNDATAEMLNPHTCMFLLLESEKQWHTCFWVGIDKRIKLLFLFFALFIFCFIYLFYFIPGIMIYTWRYYSVPSSLPNLPLMKCSTFRSLFYTLFKVYTGSLPFSTIFVGSVSGKMMFGPILLHSPLQLCWHSQSATNSLVLSDAV